MFIPNQENQSLVQVDSNLGVYRLCDNKAYVRNVKAYLSYTSGGQPYTLDLIRGAAVIRGHLGKQHLIEVLSHDGLVSATLSLSYREGETNLNISAKVQLVAAGAEIQLDSVVLFEASFEETFLAPLGRENCRFWRNWHDIWFPIGSMPLDGPQEVAEIDKPLAYHFASLYCSAPKAALTFGYQMPNRWIDAIEFKAGGALVADNKIGVKLLAHQPVHSDELTVSLGPIFTEAAPTLHRSSAPRRKVEEARDNFGWNSWEAYHTDITEADVLENMEEIAKLPWLRERISTIIIDDGWQCNKSDWFANEKFPDGMDGMADKIRARGFRAGIWTAPFWVSKQSKLLECHPKWLLQDKGEPLTVHGEVFYLDPTHPEARAYIHSVYKRLHDWGYRYYKTDFLVEAPMFFVPGRPEYRETARCYDPDLGIMRGMRATMQAMRAAMGEDSFWLGCGTDIGCGAGLMDASRTGGDIAPFWTRVPNQARSVIHNFHLHGKLFLADPDFTLIKSKDTFHAEYLDIPLESSEPYVVDAWHGGHCFDADDVRTWASLVILSGGLVNLSDRIKGLNELGHSILKTVLEYAGGQAAVPLDVESPIPHVLLREEKTHYLLGLLNWDNERTITATANKAMGIAFPKSGKVQELWSGADWCVKNGEISVSLEPHKSLLFKWNKS